MSDARDAQRGGPFEEQREIYELLSQETRHLVLQYVIAHPEHVLSLDELAYLIPKNKAAIRDQLQRLREEEIIELYEYPPNQDTRDLPSQFYGLTEFGVDVLDEYNYLRGLPVARALYDNTRLSEKVERHRDAPRPDLPTVVDQALRIEDESQDDLGQLEEYIRAKNAETASLDDQIEVAKAFYRNDIYPDHDGIKRHELTDVFDLDLDYQPRTILKTLVDIAVLERMEPAGPSVYPISERSDETVAGRSQEEAERNIEALVQHVDDELQTLHLRDRGDVESDRRESVTSPSIALADGAGTTIRTILAQEFAIPPEDVTRYLQSGEPIDRLNAAVEAIETSDEVTKAEEYGRILFVAPAHRYRLSEDALKLTS